jgi:hypothetical protein
MDSMGQGKRLPESLSPAKLIYFPKLSPANHRVHSEESDRYNCVAFAADDDQRIWRPDQHYWPPRAKRGDDIESLISVFEAIGYELCEDGSVEPEYEKVALYGDADGWLHAAKQHDSGWWLSKLGGEWEDIRHSTVDLLTGELGYGEVKYYMKRQRKHETKPAKTASET